MQLSLRFGSVLSSTDWHVYQIIPQIGLESAPADMLAWSIVRLIREKLSVGTREVVHSIEDMKYAFAIIRNTIEELLSPYLDPDYQVGEPSLQPLGCWITTASKLSTIH